MTRWIPTECACCGQMTAYAIAGAVNPNGSTHQRLDTVRCDKCRLGCPNRLSCKTRAS